MPAYVRVLNTEIGWEETIFDSQLHLGEYELLEGVKAVNELGDPLPAVQREKPADYPEGDPSTEWTGKQLKAYAAAHNIDLGSATNKAAVLEAIQAPEEPEPDHESLSSNQAGQAATDNKEA